MSEEKKKMYYYYGGKEKKAGEVKKSSSEIAPYIMQRDFERMMDRFEREFGDFWGMPPMTKQWMHERPGFPMMPFKQMTLPSVTLKIGEMLSE